MMSNNCYCLLLYGSSIQTETTVKIFQNGNYKVPVNNNFSCSVFTSSLSSFISVQITLPCQAAIFMKQCCQISISIYMSVVARYISSYCPNLMND